MDVLRVGVIGCGGAAGWHAEVLAKSADFEIVALTEPNEQNLERFRTRVPAVAEVPAFADAEQMYQQVDVDAVTIVTPHTLHYPLIMGAIKQGVHVLCEKPMTHTSAHAREIEEAASIAGVTVMVQYQRRFFPTYMYMKQAIESGELGELRTISAHCGQSWQRNSAGKWRQQPELSGGGMLMDSGSHLTDVLLWLAGRPVEQVSALVDNLGSPVDINTSATVRFAGGAHGQLTVIGDYPGVWTETVVVTGTEASLRYEIDPQHPWRVGRVTHHQRDGIYRPLQLPKAPEGIEAWADVIRGREPNPSPAGVGFQVAQLCEAMYRSSEAGGQVINLV